jgi:hypothetical protein
MLMKSRLLPTECFSFALVLALWFSFGASDVCGEPHPNKFTIQGYEEYSKTGVIPETLYLAYFPNRSAAPTVDAWVLMRSPYFFPPSGSGFSDGQCTAHEFQAQPVDPGVMLIFPLGIGCLRGYEDWALSRRPAPRGELRHNVAWRVNGDQSNLVEESGDLFPLYLDVYNTQSITDEGITIRRVTESCPEDIQPLPKCRPLPAFPGNASPLFVKRFKHNYRSGWVKIFRIWEITGGMVADVGLYSPDERGIFPKQGICMTVAVGEKLELPGLQAYTIRRIVAPGKVTLADGVVANIRHGWIEIEVENSAGEQ